MTPGGIVIRRAAEEDAEDFRSIRLEALRVHPEAFGADYETDAARSLDDWRLRLRGNGVTPSCVFVAQAGDRLVGTAGGFCGSSSKTRHSVTVWGVYVCPEARGQGIAARLLDACCEWARAQNAVVVKLAVVGTNTAAIRAYSRAGFRVYGIEPKALCLDSVYFNELLLAKLL